MFEELLVMINDIIISIFKCGFLERYLTNVKTLLGCCKLDFDKKKYNSILNCAFVGDIQQKESDSILLLQA